MALHEVRRDITLDELGRELGQKGVTVAISTLHRFFARLKAMPCKTGEWTVFGLWELIGKLVDLLQTQEWANYFKFFYYIRK